MITAYKTTAAFALQTTAIVQKPVLHHFKLQFDYTQINEVMMIVKQFDCVVEKNEMQLFCVMNIGVPQNWLAEVENKVKDLREVELEKL